MRASRVDDGPRQAIPFYPATNDYIAQIIPRHTGDIISLRAVGPNTCGKNRGNGDQRLQTIPKVKLDGGYSKKTHNKKDRQQYKRINFSIGHFTPSYIYLIQSKQISLVKDN
jgi:hypothetical protein